MKKIKRVLTLSVMTALALSLVVALSLFVGADSAESSELLPDRASLGKYFYIAYESEEDYLADKADGVFDGKIGTETCIIESLSNNTSNELTLPQESSYVYVLADLSYIKSSSIKVSTSVVIDLGGKTLDMKEKSQISLSSAAKDAEKTVLTLKGGNLLINTTVSGQVFNTYPGTELKLIGLNMEKSKDTSANIINDRGADLLFKDTYLKDNTLNPVIYFTTMYYEGYSNCSCVKCKIAAKNGTPSYKNSFIFDNFTYDVAATYPNWFMRSYKSAHGTGSMMSDTDIKFIGGSCLEFCQGGYMFGGDVGSGSTVEVYVEEGVRLANANESTFKAGGLYTLKYVRADGTEIDPADIKCGASGIPDYPNQIGTAFYEVRWYTFDGNLIEKVTYINGILPTHASPEHTEPYFVAEDGNVYCRIHTGWSKTEGADSADEIEPVSSDISYYAYFSDILPTFVLYDFEGEGATVLSASSNGAITADIVSSIPTGAYFKANGNLYLASLDVAASLYSANSFTLDLSGYTLSLSDAEGGFTTLNAPVAKLTVKNGTLYSEGAPAISVSEGGKIDLYGVNVRSINSHALSLTGGSVSLFGGSIKADGTRGVTSAIVAELTGEATLSLYGTSIKAANTYANADGIAVSAKSGAASPILNLNLGKNENSGFSVSVDADFISVAESTNAAKINITLDNVDVFFLGELVSSENGKIDVTVNLIGDSKVAPQKADVSFVAEEGKKIMFPLEDGLPVIILNADLTLYTSISVFEDLILNLYIPKTSDIAYLEIYGSVVFEKSKANTYELTTKEGIECYKIQTKLLYANSANSSLPITLGAFDEAENIYVCDSSYSLVDYCEKIVNGDYLSVTKNLARAVLNYVRAADAFFTDGFYVSEEDAARIDSLLLSYTPSLVKADELDLSELSGLVKSIQYKLTSETALVITLTDGAKTENISLTYSDGSELLSLEDTDNSQIIISIPAYKLNAPLTLTVGEKSATLSFAAYANKLLEDTDDDALKALILAVYDLGARANTYEDRSRGEIDTSGGDTPNARPEFDFEDYKEP